AAEALVHFRAVADGDPKDAYAAYYLAQCLAQQSEYEQALEWYRRSLALDPYLRSAYYGTFQAMQRLKLRKEARQVIMDYQRLAKNPRARLVEFKYTRMGSKGEALAINMATPAVVKRPQGPLFSPPRPLIEAVGKGISGTRWAPSRPAGVTPVDMQGDGVLELFITNVAGGEGDSSLLMSRGADGNFSPLPSHPLAGVSKVNATLWGDFDNDGLTDVYLCRRGRNQLWRQVVKGEWEDVTAATGTANGELDTVDGAFFDADHDGDLDLFLINADGPNELLNNNLNGSFRPIAVEQGIAGKQTASRGVVLMDLDRDRDTDLVIINREPPHEVFLNDRLWSYHPATGFGGFNALPALAAVAGDLDADGIPELYSMMETGRLLRWRLDNNGDYQSQSLGEFTLGTEEGANGFAQLAILDANGDGRLELLVATGAGWWIFDPEQRRRLFQAEAVGTDRLIGVAPFLDDPTTGPAVVGVMAGGGMKVWRSGTGRHSYLSFALSGREESGQSMRSNASGIGARVAVRTGSRWSMPPAFGGFSGPGRGLQPISVGLGGASRADFVSIDWSDGVYQSELDLEAGGVHRITETQRQLSSCPVLFAWDGEQYRFISDLLGVGGLGYAVAPGEYAPPRPWENLLLPEGLLHSRDGRYLLKFTEPMEEAAYLDGARLVAWDLPPGWKMVLDERMGITGPEPTGKARFYRGEMTPSRVENDRGEVVTAQVNLTDGRAATVGPLDHRFIGRLRREHVLVLEFPEPLDAYSGAPMLVADGWVEYPYSQTMFAAWQAEAEFAAPTLEARGEDGAWHTVMEQFGYPAGMPRRMSVPLKNLP
ncbi:MAG: tetratricopeptide repeat protein, partial [Gammaproteobacteria bacterium]|nr:tetratricopeptide repeat protein [Gammaproteobacteria bacterium]